MEGFPVSHKYRLQRAVSRVRESLAYHCLPLQSDFALWQRADYGIATHFGPDGLANLQDRIKSLNRAVVDLGMGRYPLRSIIFFDALNTTGIDPAYQDYESQPSFDRDSYNRNVFSGAGEKQLMWEHLRQAFRDIQMPGSIKGPDKKIIQATRHGKERRITLVPQDAVDWIRQQPAYSVPNLVVWRVFLPTEEWGLLLSKLKPGGVIITTGQGKVQGEVEEFDQVVCGFDLDNSPLPANGDFKEIGLEPISDVFPERYFYRKVRHVDPTRIAQVLRAK